MAVRGRFGLDVRFPQGVKGIIFDCDGVLFDSRQSNIQYYNKLLAVMGIGPMSESQEHYVHMHTVDESLRHIVPEAHRHRLPAARASISYREHILPLLVPEPGLYELLWWLRDAGIRAAVHTNRSNSMEYVLEHFDMTELFMPVMTASKVRAKPHPEGTTTILRTWGMDRRDVAFIGDTQLDEETARAAGVTFWAYRSPALLAQMHVNDFWDLRATLQEAREALQG